MCRKAGGFHNRTALAHGLMSFPLYVKALRIFLAFAKEIRIADLSLYSFMKVVQPQSF